MALAAKLDGKGHKVFCLMGDGEQQEARSGAAMEADTSTWTTSSASSMQCLQIDGWVKDVMQVEPLNEKYASFAGSSAHRRPRHEPGR